MGNVVRHVIPAHPGYFLVGPLMGDGPCDVVGVWETPIIAWIIEILGDRDSNASPIYTPIGLEASGEGTSYVVRHGDLYASQECTTHSSLDGVLAEFRAIAKAEHEGRELARAGKRPMP